ncbi:Putative ribonuclease H protein [Dendrobium catenatum]|uniref:Ribonuclease H protein n=1 Tax=Dendrobium catenatum TaxID=906689 RepID=A0A2I0X874_9ASPA|nr:Putative ribonuclease H protein [Dendrobium catenatum]
MVNDCWLGNFLSSFYIVDNPQISDHSPIILRIDQSKHRNHRFPFKNYWLANSEFWDSLIQVFSQRFHSSPIHAFFKKLKTLKISIKSKNWASSNSLQTDISDLTASQNNFLCQIQTNPLDTDLNLALKDINHKLAVKNSDWSSWIIQRAKAKWLSNGEDDLKFLYSRINVRQNTNQIKCITTVEGTFSNPDDINRAIVNHFHKLFNTAPPLIFYSRAPPIHQLLPSSFIPLLVAPVTMEEIKNVIFSSPACSAPGPDGYTFEFYKSTWNTISRQLTDVVLSFFSTGSMPKQAKATAIVLIPKRPHAQDIVDYRPISLCNTFYKIIAKILANRLKDVMPFIIHPSQSGFIKDRIIFDNILLAAELLKEFNSNHKDQFFCAKFDIHKGFDTVSRKFLIERLLAKGFPEIFADDLLVFAKATLENAPHLNCILDDFFSLSGLRVNNSKSKIVFSKNSSQEQAISNIMNIPISSSPIKYLGIPIFYKKLKIVDFQPLMHKIAVSLDGWKARSLSMAGRLQYLKHTINNILMYWIRGTLLPKSCIKKIKSLCSRFLFYGDIQKRKIHLISWKDTCKPKIYGGLGIPYIESLYFACGCTVIWRFYSSKSFLFCWWKEKYGSLWNTQITKCYSYWKNLCDVAKNLLYSLNFKIIPSSNLSFYWDPWCFGLSVADRLKQENLDYMITKTNVSVCNHISNGTWTLPASLTAHIADLIRSIPFSVGLEDCCWINPAKPSFKTFFNEFYEDVEKVNWHNFVWHKHSSLRFVVFSLIAFNDGLKTASVLAARGISVFPLCVFCKSNIETQNHLFFECDFSFNIL